MGFDQQSGNTIYHGCRITGACWMASQMSMPNPHTYETGWIPVDLEKVQLNWEPIPEIPNLLNQILR